MDHDAQLAHRARLLAAGWARLAADDRDPNAPTGRVVEDSDTTRQMLYAAAGDDCQVMVLVAWTRAYLRPEYAEDLVIAQAPDGSRR